MITDAIGGFLISVAEAILGALPTASSLDLMGFSQAVGAFRALDSGIPATETIAMAAMCLTIIGGIFVVRLALTIWHAIPGKFS